MRSSNLRLSKEELDKVKRERDDLSERKQALDRIDTYVWKKPDAHGHNRFVPAKGRKTRFFALCNLKGGVGKTTLALNLGATLTQAGKTVLLVDLDFQGTLSNLAMESTELKDARDKRLCIETLLNTAFNGDIRHFMFRTQEIPECKVLPASDELELIDYKQQSRFFLDQQHEVRFFLQRLLHTPAFLQEFDYVLFDCPPRMSTACINALTCADYVLVPTGLSQLDIEAVPRTLQWLAQLHAVVQARFLGVVITRGRMRSGKLIKNEIRQLNRLKETVLVQPDLEEWPR